MKLNSQRDAFHIFLMILWLIFGCGGRGLPKGLDKDDVGYGGATSSCGLLPGWLGLIQIW